MRNRQIQFQWKRFQRHFTRFTWGGAWASSLPAETRRNLTLFFYDGFYAAISDKITLTYMTLYLLSLGATRQQIGLLSSFSNFAAAFLLLPAALLVERTGKRKQTTVTSITGSRIITVFMALLPFMIKDFSGLIWIILGLALLREVFNNFSYPGWISLTGEIVPIEGRGRYFGTRNFIMGIAGIITALVIGEAITRIGEPLGYQIAFLLSAGFGTLALFYFARLREPQTSPQPQEALSKGLKTILTSLKAHPQFVSFCLFTAVWNFSLNIAGPFFNVYMVDTLKFTAAMISVTNVTHTATNLLVQRRMGALADKWGNRKVSIIFTFLIPIIPIFWGLWVRQYWQAIVVEAFAGAFWGAYNLASFNNLLNHTPESQRARFSAYYQIVVTLALAGGAALGSYLIPKIDFSGVAVSSAIGRFLAAILFLLIVRDVTHPTQADAA